MKRIKFTSALAEITALSLIGVNLYENISAVYLQLSIIKVVQIVFLLVLLGVYFYKHQVFISMLSTWGIILTILSLIGLFGVFVGDGDIVSYRGLVGIFGIIIGAILYHIATDYIEIEFVSSTKED